MTIRSLQYMLLAALVLLAGCQKMFNGNEPANKTRFKDKYDIISANEFGVDALLNNAIANLDRDKPIIVTSLVSVNDLSRSSTLGRISSDIIANRLSQHGFTVKEVKMGTNRIFIRRGNGEFVLSRELQNVADEFDVQAILVGTYALGEHVQFTEFDDDTIFCKGVKRVFISLRMVETQDNTIVCSSNYAIAIKDTSVLK